MKRRKVMLIVAAGLIFLAGCGNVQKEESASPGSEGISQDAQEAATGDTDAAGKGIPEIKSPIITFTDRWEEIPSDDGKVTLVYAGFMEPEFHMEEQKTVEKLTSAFSDIRSGYESELREYTQEAETYYQEAGEDMEPYSLVYSFELKRSDSGVISVVQKCYSAMGGVHGYLAESGLNFDRKTGEKLELDDISTDREALLASAKEYIMNELELPRYKESLYEGGEGVSEALDEMVLTEDCWYFTNSGITFVANPYCIGPYAAGSFYFDVPYECLDGLKTEYRYEGPYELSLPIGGTGTADMDGDGKEDTISYQCTVDDTMSEVQPVLTINGKDYSDVFRNEGCYLSEGAGEYCADRFYIVDLDTSDAYMELAVRDLGPSDDYATLFFRYDGDTVIFLGYVEDLMGSSTTILNGDGTVQTVMHTSIPETVMATVFCALNDKPGLERMEQEMYELEYTGRSEGRIHEILKDITVHKEKDRDSEAVVLSAEDGPVTFLATDNEHWFSFRAEDGTVYYLYMENSFETEDGQDIQEVFEGIVQAG